MERTAAANAAAAGTRLALSQAASNAASGARGLMHMISQGRRGSSGSGSGAVQAVTELVREDRA